MTKVIKSVHKTSLTVSVSSKAAPTKGAVISTNPVNK